MKPVAVALAAMVTTTMAACHADGSDPFPPAAVPPIAFDVDGPFTLAGPDCSLANATGAVARGTLDLAASGTRPAHYAAVVRAVDAGIFAAGLDLRETDVFYTLDRGAIADPGLPTSSATAHANDFERCADCPSFVGPAGILATLVSADDAQRLLVDDTVASLLRENGRVGLAVHATLGGFGADGAVATSSEISFPIDLCVGCLAGPARCPGSADPVRNPAACLAGDDVPAQVCP